MHMNIPLISLPVLVAALCLVAAMDPRDPHTATIHSSIENGNGAGGSLLNRANAGFAPGIRRTDTPPMGWRSWNYFMCGINQTLMEAQMDALVEKRSLGMQAGPSTSLHDLGYFSIGLDDCWQDCMYVPCCS